MPAIWLMEALNIHQKLQARSVSTHNTLWMHTHFTGTSDSANRDTGNAGSARIHSETNSHKESKLASFWQWHKPLFRSGILEKSILVYALSHIPVRHTVWAPLMVPLWNMYPVFCSLFSLCYFHNPQSYPETMFLCPSRKKKHQVNRGKMGSFHVSSILYLGLSLYHNYTQSCLSWL